ncbi:MAG: pyridoxal-phosphate dependent enzyme [Candidatus Dormibacteria bacterium]
MSGARPASGQGQWVHAALFQASLPAQCRVTLQEGNTPLQHAPELSARLQIPGLFLKREDLSPTGSHKARSLGLLVSDLLARGQEQAVISSSGNAAVAAAAYSRAAGIRILCLISPLTPRVKLEAILEHRPTVVASPHPVELLHHAVSCWGLTDLRASTNPLGPTAYRGISAELADLGDWQAVFTFANSGATALGIHAGFLRLGSPTPQLHVVEGWPGGELTRPWYPRDEAHTPTEVGELGTRRSRLAPAVRRAVRESGGRGWRATGAELEEMQALCHDLTPGTSWEGLAALAAAASWARAALPGGRVGVLLTGAPAQLDQAPHPRIAELVPMANTPEELDHILGGAGFQRLAHGG